MQRWSQQLPNMKTSTTLLIASTIAALSGLAFATVGNVLPAFSLGGDTVLALFFSVAFALTFIRDFTRRPSFRPLDETRKPAPLLRPAAPIFLDARRASAERLDVSDNIAA